MNQKIDVSAGAVEYVTADIVETSGKNISLDSAQMCLLATTVLFPLDSDWKTATILQVPSPSNLKAGLLVGADYKPDPNTYNVWLKLHDVDEAIVRRIDNGLVTIV